MEWAYDKQAPAATAHVWLGTATWLHQMLNEYRISLTSITSYSALHFMCTCALYVGRMQSRWVSNRPCFNKWFGKDHMKGILGLPNAPSIVAFGLQCQEFTRIKVGGPGRPKFRNWFGKSLIDLTSTCTIIHKQKMIWQSIKSRVNWSERDLVNYQKYSLSQEFGMHLARATTNGIEIIRCAIFNLLRGHCQPGKCTQKAVWVGFYGPLTQKISTSSS